MVFTRAAAVAFASSAALAMLFASTLAVADGTDADHDGIPDNLEDATERTVAATTRGDAFDVSSHLGSGHLEDQFELSYQAGRFDVWYSGPNGVSSSYQLEFQNLIEWRDFNGNGTIDPKEIVRAIPLGASAFGDVPVTASNRSDPDGGRVFTFNIPDRGGNVTLNMTIARRFMRIDNVVLTPMEARLDIAIRSDIAPQGTNVGIELRAETVQRVRFEDQSWDELHQWAPSERSMNVTAGEGERSATVFFSWARTATANAQSIPVTLGVGAANGTTYSMYFGYPFSPTPPTGVITHHTTLGVLSVVYEIRQGTGPEVQGDLPLFAGTFAAVAAAVGATFFLVNRHRRGRDAPGRKP